MATIESKKVIIIKLDSLGAITLTNAHGDIKLLVTRYRNTGTKRSGAPDDTAEVSLSLADVGAIIQALEEI